MNKPPPFSHEWWLQIPPQRCGDYVRGYERRKHRLSPEMREHIERDLLSVDVADQLDRDIDRVLPHYGLRRLPLVQDLLELAKMAAQRHGELEQDPYLCDKMRAGILAASCKVNRHYMRKAWGSEEKEG